MLKKGDIIWFENKNRYSKHVQMGKRPAVILQNDIGSHYGTTYIIAMMTTKIKKTYLPTHVIIENSALKRRSMVMLEQILTIDELDIIERVGSLTFEESQKVDEACLSSLGLKKLIASQSASLQEEPFKIVMSDSPALLFHHQTASQIKQLPTYERFKINEITLQQGDEHFILHNKQVTLNIQEHKVQLSLNELRSLIEKLELVNHLMIHL